MNKTEEKTLRWLLRQGIPRKSIHYQTRRSPDFITEDGRWFEAKRILGRAIVFGANQFKELKKNANRTTVLAFTDDSEEPVIIPMSEIEPDRIIKGIKTYIASEPKSKRIRVSLETYEWLRNHGKMTESFDDVIKRLIVFYEGRKNGSDTD